MVDSDFPFLFLDNRANIIVCISLPYNFHDEYSGSCYCWNVLSCNVVAFNWWAKRAEDPGRPLSPSSRRRIQWEVYNSFRDWNFQVRMKDCWVHVLVKVLSSHRIQAAMNWDHSVKDIGQRARLPPLHSGYSPTANRNIKRFWSFEFCGDHTWLTFMSGAKTNKWHVIST